MVKGVYERKVKIWRQEISYSYGKFRVFKVLRYFAAAQNSLQFLNDTRLFNTCFLKRREKCAFLPAAAHCLFY